jgi:cell division protein FtsA
MNEKKIVVGLDIGTTKVCTIVGQIGPNSELEIIGIGTHPSHGLKKGSVVNIDKTIHSIQSSLEEAKLMSGVNITEAAIGIAGSHIYSFNSSGVVAVKGREITQDDIDRVLEAAQAVVIPSDREVIHVIPQEFKVDNQTGIKNPIGMCGVRLEAHVHVVTGSISLIQNLVKCVEQTGIKATELILQPIASSEAVLSAEEKELGVCLVDIGGGTTDIAIWKGGSLIHSQIIPVGGSHFTNDLAVALKIPHLEAERIKINHGCVLSEQLNQSAHITVQGIPGTKSREIKINVIADVLGARAHELFQLIDASLQDKRVGSEISGGVIITGGGALIKGMQELAEYILKKPVKIGYPRSFGGMTNIMQNPKFSTVLGLLLEGAKNGHEQIVTKNNEEQSRLVSQGDLISKLSESLKSVFKEIF